MCAIRQIFFIAVICYANVLSQSSPPVAMNEVGESLFLTPLIDAGNLSAARNLSRVTPLLDSVESFAGFLTVNRTTKSHLHFWFIPRTVHDGDETATPVPLILYIRETYTLFGMFYENGPFHLTEEGELKKREHAWTNKYNVLYMDALIGIGYSFTEGEGYVKSFTDVGDYIYNALVQFYKLYPEFSASDLYIAGDGGTFVPAIGHRIHTANTQSGVWKMPLKGIMVGNGISDLEETKIFYATYLHSVGLIDEHERHRLEEILQSMKFAIRSGNWTLAADEDVKLNAQIFNMIGTVSTYDYTRDSSHVQTLVDVYTKYITRDAVRKSVHVGGVKFDSGVSEASKYLQTNFGRPVRPLIEELLDGEYEVLFYNGQFDLSSSHLLTSKFLNSLRWHGAYEYNVARKRVWQVGESVAGYYKKASNLAYVMIRKAGHMASFDQPENVLRMIDSFTGKTWLGD